MSDFEQFLSRFEDRPTAVPPRLPQPVIEEPRWEIRLVSLWDAILAGGHFVGRCFMLVYLLVFWTTVMLILGGAILLALEAILMNPHEVSIGETQIGKSATVVLRTAAELEDPNTSVVCIGSQPDSTADDLYAEAVRRGQSHRTVLEDFDDFEQVISRDWLAPSEQEEWSRFAEDKRTIELRLDALARRRGFTNLDDHPSILEYGEPAHWLMLKQEPRKPLRQLQYAFQPGSAEHRQLVRDCTDEAVANAFQFLPRHRASLDRLAGPASRFTSVYWRSPALIVRDRPGCGNALIEMLERGFHYFISGGRVITKEEWRFICATIGLEIIRYKENGGQRRIVLIYEESEANASIGPFEAAAMQTLAKTGLSIRLIAQDPFWYSPEVTNVVLQNSNHLWFRSASANVAEIAAHDLSPAIHPYALKQLEYQVRQYHAGWESVPVETETELDRGGTNHSVTHRDRPIIEYEVSERPTYFMPHEQIALFKKWNMQTDVGEAFAKCEGRVSLVRFPEPRRLISESEVVREYLEHRNRWPFTTSPGFDPMAASLGEDETTPHSVSFIIRRRIGKRSRPGSSPLTEWPSDEPTDSANESEADA